MLSKSSAAGFVTCGNVLMGFLFYRRIAYQETSQTFGVISMRMDIQEGSSMTPSRSSASTHAASSSSSSTSKMVSTGTSMMGEHMFGDEVEVHSFLVIDQHTFEGTFWSLDECYAADLLYGGNG